MDGRASGILRLPTESEPYAGRHSCKEVRGGIFELHGELEVPAVLWAKIQDEWTSSFRSEVCMIGKRARQIQGTPKDLCN